MTTNEAIISISDIVEKIRDSNNNVIKSTSDLEIVLLNLRIVNAHIKENTGIEPIIDFLEKTIHSINGNIKTLVSENRSQLNNAIDQLRKESNHG
jgi:hypothetical protein